jgi:hypothetical protein
VVDQPLSTHLWVLAVDECSSARLLSIRPSSLRKDLIKGHLAVPFIKIGRRVLYRCQDLDDWLQRNKKCVMKTVSEFGSMFIANSLLVQICS